MLKLKDLRKIKNQIKLIVVLAGWKARFFYFRCVNFNDKGVNKIICTKCGEYFGHFKIHPDWYGGIWSWRCRNKYSKNNKCVMRHLYDDNVHQAINVAVFEILAYSICKIDYLEGDIEKLETRVKYKKLDDGVNSNAKYAVRVYFRFLEQRK